MLLVGALMMLGSACSYEGDAYVTGVLRSGSEPLDAYGQAVLLRAVPDHIDGFSPDRPYMGDRFLEASCPLEHTEFPVDFIMFGDHSDVVGAPPRWLLLAWVGDSEDETWIRTGQRYGTATFEFIQGYDSSWADSIEIELDQTYGQR